MTSPGWAYFPTRRNGRGEPKLPKLDDVRSFVRLRPEQNEAHDWDGAAGIAVALGNSSGGLAVIDVDDAGLASYLAARLLQTPAPPLMSRTPNGLHVFTLGPTAPPADLAVKYPGVPASRYCRVQLLSADCYAVVPPTAGYSWLNKGAEPAYGAVDEVWRRLALAHATPWTKARAWHFQPHERPASPRLSTGEIRRALR